MSQDSKDDIQDASSTSGEVIDFNTRKHPHTHKRKEDKVKNIKKAFSKALKIDTKKTKKKNKRKKK